MGFLCSISFATRALGLFGWQFLTKRLLISTSTLLIIGAGFVQVFGWKKQKKTHIFEKGQKYGKIGLLDTVHRKLEAELNRLVSNY